MEPSRVPAPSDRREFLAKACALTVGAVTVVIPAAAGMFVLLDPLRRKSESGDAVQVASFGALPEDGTPMVFKLVATRVDAWNRTPNVPVGAVYLRRLGENKVQAFNATCPHAGCFVDFSAELKSYLCPCHNSAFALDGSLSDPRSPSPRGLDELPAEVREGGEVWVKFQNFRAGVAERIPV